MPTFPPLPSQTERSVYLSELGFFAQEAYQCGPASLATVIDYWQPALMLQPNELVPKVWTPAVKGSWQLEMQASVRRYGLVAYAQPMAAEALFKELSAGHPVIVLLDLGTLGIEQWHYAVLAGFDKDRELVILRSGKTKKRLMHWRHFIKAWRKANYWGLVALPANRLPASLTWAQVYKSLSDYEQVRGQAQLASWQLAQQHWPDQWQFLFAAGNAAYQLEDSRLAQQYYLGALALKSDQAQLWNNLAYSLARQRCSVSLAALGCAQALEPANTAWRQSETELLLQAELFDQACGTLPSCPVKPKPRSKANEERPL
ncbi:PA2778 family cysteine peptidase [Agaribacterium haliotis]|uniref:PA2778 family cysteine peptidase n=1 Tax=Agaribacterium haliotis TaxID=2013869 RepID=UPI001303F877|nr:PA2778 family cysteine peptidase [Agaribacterium haliotis]